MGSTSSREATYSATLSTKGATGIPRGLVWAVTVLVVVRYLVCFDMEMTWARREEEEEGQ